MYRIIDITLSNCLNSDLRRVYILTQYKALSLNRHIREGWNIWAARWRVHRSSSTHKRVTISGIRAPPTRLPEHLFDRLRATQARPHPVRRSHLQNGLWQDDEAASRLRCRHHPGYHPDRSRRDLALRRGRRRQRRPHQWLRRETQRDQTAFPWNPQKVPALWASTSSMPTSSSLCYSKTPRTSLSSHDFGKDILPKMVDDYRVFAYDFIDENKKEALYWRDWARSRPTTKPTWISSPSLRSSSLRSRLAHSHTSASIRRRSLSSRKKIAWVRRLIPSSPMAASSLVEREEFRALSRRAGELLYRSRRLYSVLARRGGTPLPRPPLHHRPQRPPARRHPPSATTLRPTAPATS